MMNDFEKIKLMFEKQGLFIGVVYDATDLDVRYTEDLDVIMKHWSPKIDILDELDSISLTSRRFDIANKFTELTQSQRRRFLHEIYAIRGVSDE